ncbi:MAG: hypothetical protein ABI112_15815, partial [Terracoccus sp.]
MNTTGSILERLRQQLADLESNQRRSGGTATAEFWSTPSPDAAEPAPSDAAEPSHESGVGAEAADPMTTSSARSGGFPLAFTLDWSTFTAVRGRLAPTFAFAAGITRLPHLATTSVDEDDL